MTMPQVDAFMPGHLLCRLTLSLSDTSRVAATQERVIFLRCLCAATEPRHTVRRARCPPGPRARVRQSRLPARRGRTNPPPVCGPALDRVPAAVPGLAAP